jgi:hypothetical protein
MPFDRDLEASLREFATAGAADLCENGSRLAPLSKLSWEVRGAGDKPLLHIWSEEYNLTRRVLAITDHSETRLVLAVEKFGRTRPDRLEFVRVDFQRPARELAREQFCARLKNILATQFPDESVESASVSADLEHSLSGNYVRGLFKRGSFYTAFLAVPEGETSDTINNCVTFAILWIDRARHTVHRGTVGGLRLILPKQSCAVVAHRLAAIDVAAPIELYEYDGTSETLKKIDPQRAANLSTWLVPAREPEALLAQARSAVDPIVAFDPKAIAVHPSVASREVILRYRGLPFARWDDRRVFFGINDMREELTPLTQNKFDAMMRTLNSYRHPLASETRHTLYRAQAERWLESIVRSEVTRIDATLDSRFVYSQVFAAGGGEHGILDILAITRTGRLAIIELKAAEHIHLPIQAADYWLRVQRHLTLGEFRAYGFFPGVEIQQAPPLVYLVAPSLRFHPATATLLRHLNREIEVIRVGLTESWRRGIRVVSRQ